MGATTVDVIESSVGRPRTVEYSYLNEGYPLVDHDGYAENYPSTPIRYFAEPEFYDIDETAMGG